LERPDDIRLADPPVGGGESEELFLELVGQGVRRAVGMFCKESADGFGLPEVPGRLLPSLLV